MEKCALQHSSSLWEWVEEALDSRTRPWLGVPPFIRADDSTAPVSMLSGGNPSLSLVGILGLEGVGTMVLWQPKGSGELAPVRALAVCPKEKPVEEVALMNLHCPERRVYGKGEEQAGGSPPSRISKLPTGLLGAWAPGGRDSWKVTCFAARVMQRAWSLDSAQGT